MAVTEDPIREHLVLIHGLGSAASYWDNIVPALSEAFSVSAVNLPGHGPGAHRLSSEEAAPKALAASVIEQLEAQGIVRPHVVGLSLGGWVALEIAVAGFAASVVGLAPAGLWRAGTHVHREREESLVRLGLAVLGPALPSITKLPLIKEIGLRANVHFPGKVSYAQFLAGAQALKQAKAYSACDKQAVHQRFEDGAAITVPVHVAFGDHDRVLPAHTSQEQSLLPEHARFTIVKECGHAMTWDQPEACVSLIKETAAMAL
jgi:pimeloyl-ACP methyl ester carboxylesterase